MPPSTRSSLRRASRSRSSASSAGPSATSRSRRTNASSKGGSAKTQPGTTGRYIQAASHLCRVEHLFYGREVICLKPVGECKKHAPGRAKGSDVRREAGLYRETAVGQKTFALPGSLTTAEAQEENRSRRRAHDEALTRAMVESGGLDSVRSLDDPPPTRRRLALPTELAPDGLPVLPPRETPRSSLARAAMLPTSTPPNFVGPDLDETSPDHPRSAAHETPTAPGSMSK